MADDATFAARMNAARSMSPAPAPKAAPPPAAKPPPKPEPAADALPDGDDGAGPEPEAPAEKPAETPETEAPAGETQSADERLAAAQAAWDKGDFEGASKILGKKAGDPIKRGFVALDKAREKERARVAREDKVLETKRAEIAKAQAEVVQESQRVSAMLRHGDQKYGWVARAEQAWDNDDKVAFAKSVEKLAKGASLATITQWLAGAAPKPVEDKSVTEERAKLQREREEWERQKAAEKAEREKAQASQSTEEKRTERIAKFGTKFKDHPYLADPDSPGKVDPDAVNEAFEAYAKTWKNGRFEKKASEVLDELHAKELRRAKKLGLVAAPAAGKKPPAARLPEPPPTVKGEAGRAPLADRIALAKRMGEMQRRGVR